MTALSWWPVATALLFGDIPEAVRIKKLAPYFSPRPGSAIQLSGDEVRDYGLVKDPRRLRGFIDIKPPARACLTITRNKDFSDTRVCKPKRLAFTLDDLDKAGRIIWKVTTGDGDFGTEIMWTSRYRVATVTPEGQAKSEPPVYKFIADCVASKGEAGRRIELKFFGQKSPWIFRFPDQDTLVTQPAPIPNLQIVAAQGKLSVKDAPQKEGGEGKGEEEGKEHGETGGEHPALAKEQEPVVDQEDDRKVWAIPARGAFGMSAAGFLPFGSVPHGVKGTCRYIYQGATDDPETGRIECHDADGFDEVLVPLTCLKELR